MFIRYYVELSHPMAKLERAFLQSAATWMPDMAVVADERGQRLLTEVGFPVDGHYRIAKQVSVMIGKTIHSSNRTLVPISWRATGPSGLFPVLDGDLELAPLGPTRTQLALSAQYRPPLGLIGRTFDRTVLSRVAEATIKDFVDRIGQHLEAQLALGRLT